MEDSKMQLIDGALVDISSLSVSEIDRYLEGIKTKISKLESEIKQELFQE